MTNGLVIESVVSAVPYPDQIGALA